MYGLSKNNTIPKINDPRVMAFKSATISLRLTNLQEMSYRLYKIRKVNFENKARRMYRNRDRLKGSGIIPLNRNQNDMYIASEIRRTSETKKKILLLKTVTLNIRA